MVGPKWKDVDKSQLGCLRSPLHWCTQFLLHFSTPQFCFSCICGMPDYEKILVFWSPSFSHKAIDLCFHIFSSLINNPFISHFKWLTAFIVPPLVALSSACFSYCFFSFMAWVILPNETWLHCFNFSWHSFIFPSTCIIGLPEKFHLQARSTTSLHLSSLSHICSNLHGFHCLIWIPFNRMINGLWFDDPHSKCTTFVAGNMSI